VRAAAMWWLPFSILTQLTWTASLRNAAAPILSIIPTPVQEWLTASGAASVEVFRALRTGEPCDNVSLARTQLAATIGHLDLTSSTRIRAHGQR
jgi:hypothetical protein